MKKHFLLFNIFFLFSIVWICPAGAEKKYRYIKREHGVHFDMDASVKNLFHQNTEVGTVIDMEGAYTYNWKGMLEFGPYFGFNFGVKSEFSRGGLPLAWDAGLLLEYNFIKNRGKRKFIPAVGISGGANGAEGATNLSGGVHIALKIFVGKRTPFTVSLGYKMLTPMGNPFQSVYHNIDSSAGFSYYFDFY